MPQCTMAKSPKALHKHSRVCKIALMNGAWGIQAEYLSVLLVICSTGNDLLA